MRTEQTLSRNFLPKLRQSVNEEFESPKLQNQQGSLRQRNFFIRLLIGTKNSIQNVVAFFVTMAFFIPLWFFKIGLNALDLAQRVTRFAIWLHVKIFILIINFCFRLLTFLKITSVVNFLKKTAKTYLGGYSSQSIDRQQEHVTRLELIMNKKQHQLIDVKKVEKRIKTPNIFIEHEERQTLTYQDPLREEYRQKINQDLVPQRTVQQNIVETPKRIKSPQLMGLTQSHFRLKRVATEPRITASTNLQVEIELNRQNTTPLALSQRIQPDRDTSPSFYKKNYNKITSSSFKKKQHPQKEILLLHHNPIIHGTEAQKQQLTKMSELIDDNNRDIHNLQDWIKQKSQTIMMTRKQNLELLDQIQLLQKQNILKTKQFTEFQEKIKQMQKIIEKERNLKNGLNQKVERLEEEIKVKTIEIMSLKEKIKSNFEHLQNMQIIFGNQKGEYQNSPSKQQDLPYIKMIQEADQQRLPAECLANEMTAQQKQYQLQQGLLEKVSQQQLSNIKVLGDFMNQQQIQEPDVLIEVHSEKEIIQNTIQNQLEQTKSTSPVEMHIQENLEDKINQEQIMTQKMKHEVQQKLKKQQDKLIKFQHEKTTLQQKILERPNKIIQPELMHVQKPASWLMQKDQNENKQEENKDMQAVKISSKKKKNKKVKKR